MIICMFNRNHSCCSGEQIKTVTSTLLSMHLPRSSHPRARFFTISKITVHASLVTTSHFFYLLNINDELTITCGKYGRQTTRHSHSVSIIKWTDASDCVIQSVKIQLIGSHSNCSSNGNFIIYHTFNFVTEWLHNKAVMRYYRENEFSCVSNTKNSENLYYFIWPVPMLSMPLLSIAPLTPATYFSTYCPLLVFWSCYMLLSLADPNSNYLIIHKVIEVAKTYIYPQKR